MTGKCWNYTKSTTRMVTNNMSRLRYIMWHRQVPAPLEWLMIAIFAVLSCHLPQRWLPPIRAPLLPLLLVFYCWSCKAVSCRPTKYHEFLVKFVFAVCWYYDMNIYSLNMLVHYYARARLPWPSPDHVPSTYKVLLLTLNCPTSLNAMTPRMRDNMSALNWFEPELCCLGLTPPTWKC